MADKTPYWLHPDDPRYWDHQQKRILEMRSRHAEAKAPKEVSFKFSANDKFFFEEAIRLATEFHGTEGPTKAIINICRDYLEHGPHQRHLDAMAEHKAGKGSMKDSVSD